MLYIEIQMQDYINHNNNINFRTTSTSINFNSKTSIIKRFENKLYYVKHKLLIKEFIIISDQSKKLTPWGRYTVVKTVPKHYSYKIWTEKL